MSEDQERPKGLVEALRGMLVLLEMQEQLVLEALAQAEAPGETGGAKTTSRKARASRSASRRRGEAPGA